MCTESKWSSNVGRAGTMDLQKTAMSDLPAKSLKARVYFFGFLSFPLGQEKGVFLTILISIQFLAL